MVKDLLQAIRKIRNKIKYKKVMKNINNDGTQLFIDLGSSSIKASIGSEYITFRASIREVTNRNELTIANNVICVDGKWYVIGENNTPLQNVNLKCDKDNLNILILYAVKLLSEKYGIDLSNIKVNTMLPFNQLHTVDKLSKVINNNYRVSDLKGNELQVNLITNKVMGEGETSLVYLSEVYNSNKCDNTIVLNFGNSTIDCITMDNIQNARQEVMTINQGTNLLFSSYLKYLPYVSNSSLLGSFLKSGKLKFSKEEEKGIKLENELYLRSIWYDVESLIKKVNPYSTNIVVTGGGAMVLYEAIEKRLGDRYNIILPNKEDVIYSDLKGLKLICGNSNNYYITSHSNNEEITIGDNNNCNNILIKNKSLVTNDQVEKVTSNNIATNNKRNFDLFVSLRESGYSLKQIYENKLLELSYGTLKNYNCKYKKIGMI